MYSLISNLLSVSLYGLYLLADCILLWVFSLSFAILGIEQKTLYILVKAPAPALSYFSF